MNIKKGSIKTIVDEREFEKLYKPNGWVIDNGEIEKVDETKLAQELQSENKIKAMTQAKRKKNEGFNDNLFKE